MEARISAIQEELKSMFCQAEVEAERQELLRSFWEHHIVPVVDLSKEMALKYEAEVLEVWLGALFHDFALLDDSEPHDELGALRTKDFLLERGFEAQFCQKVADIVLTHRCKLYPPATLEQKIVATADAVSHFLPSFYLGIMAVSKTDYQDMQSAGINKLENDYQQKIFFEEEKQMLRERMDDFRKWFVYKTE